MVYRRKFPRRRRKRVVRKRKRASVFRPKTGYLKVIHHEIQMKTLPAGAAPLGLVDSETFDIQFLPNISEYQRLFDMYRIKAVKMKYTPLTNTDDEVNQGMLFVSSIDHDGSVLPTSLPRSFSAPMREFLRGLPVSPKTPPRQSLWLLAAEPL